MVTSDPVYVKSIRWVYEAAAAGDNVSVQDADSDVLWESVATGVNYTEEAIIENWWMNGFKVPTLGGVGAGPKLYIALG